MSPSLTWEHTTGTLIIFLFAILSFMVCDDTSGFLNDITYRHCNQISCHFSYLILSPEYTSVTHSFSVAFSSARIFLALFFCCLQWDLVVFPVLSRSLPVLFGSTLEAVGVARTSTSWFGGNKLTIFVVGLMCYPCSIDCSEWSTVSLDCH